ncbi:LOW QUALITY PROTEIN: hypothetical protein YC2023_117347 [Brassica napus]
MVTQKNEPYNCWLKFMLCDIRGLVELGGEEAIYLLKLLLEELGEQVLVMYTWRMCLYEESCLCKMKKVERSLFGACVIKPLVLQCLECKGFWHVADECANLQKPKKKTFTNSDSKMNLTMELKSIVAFTTFMSGSTTKSAVGSASASVSGSSCGGDDDAGNEDADGGSFDLVGNSEKLYEHWHKLVEVNSDLVKEKAKLEAQSHANLFEIILHNQEQDIVLYFQTILVFGANFGVSG